VVSDRLIRRLSTVGIVVCVAAVALTVASLAFPSLRSRLGFQPKRLPSYSAGERIDLPKDFYASSRLTLIVFARSTCGACQAAQPKLAAIASELAGSSIPTVLVTSGAASEQERSFATAMGIDDRHVVPFDLSTLRLQVVPTVVLVNTQGDVLFAMEGIPSDEQQQQLLRAARRSNSPA